MAQGNALYRCTSCIGAGVLCSACLKSLHRFTPTHRIKRWDKTSWVDSSLSDIRYVLYLGHNGRACPNKQPPRAPDDEEPEEIKGSSNLYIGDLNGFTRAKVLYCTCPNALLKPCQLLSAGLFPCSHLHPESAMTFQLLDMYNTLTTTGRTSGHKYYSTLERYTKPGFSAEVGDRYRELMWTHRRFLHLLLLKRSAHNFPLHPTIDAHPGDQAFDCVACPRPGFNFEWYEVSEDEMYVNKCYTHWIANVHSFYQACTSGYGSAMTGISEAYGRARRLRLVIFACPMGLPTSRSRRRTSFGQNLSHNKGNGLVLRLNAKDRN